MNAEQSRAITQLYLEMYDQLMAFACSALEHKPLAEEAVQETFRIACLKPNALCCSPNPKGWLANTLRNTIRNIKRNRDNANRLLTAYLAMQSQESAVSENKIQLEVIYEDIADLEEFQLIKEMAIDGKSYLEMACERGISLSACRKRVQRAKEVLMKKIKI